ncbi:MAG: GH3 auxin-responsive promoter family protein [Marinilabiliaceae bacterium]|nr:GH3 auxin-responsive promoter family protein [Marinilabiliaceae bacterium]
MPNILNSFISLINFRRISQIDFFKSNPIEVQKGILFSLLKKAADTEVGRMFDYQSIFSIETFQERIPVCDYEGVSPFIRRLRQGEKNLLWPGEIKWFAKSSGTTSAKSKFIPVTKESLEDCHFRGGKDVLAIYNNNYPTNNLFSGKCLTLGGSHQINNFSNDSYYGDLSAILIENMPFWTHFMRTPSQNIALMDEWEAKLEKITEATIPQDVTSLAGVPSWFMVLIKHILNKTGKKDLLEIWPNLELFIHGGIKFEPYREQYESLIPRNDMHYMETYNASEGFFAIQDDPSTKGMLLMLDYGIFYEFMPLNQVGKSHPILLTLDQIELNIDYALVITTNGGLWRYMIGDTIRFVSKNPFRIIISGRTKHFINAFGEEVVVENAVQALKIACEKTNSQIKEFTAAPLYMSAESKGAHQWIIEFEKKPVDTVKFVNELDQALKDLNSDYEAKRYKDLTLELPHLVIARENLFFDWMKQKKKLGGQNKVPKLSNNREFIDELLNMNS